MTTSNKIKVNFSFEIEEKDLEVLEESIYDMIRCASFPSDETRSNGGTNFPSWIYEMVESLEDVVEIDLDTLQKPGFL